MAKVVSSTSSILGVQDLIDDLSPMVIGELGPAEDYGYRGFAYLAEACATDRVNIKAAIEELRRHDLVEFSRGLMTDEGEVAGSGYALTDSGVRLRAIGEAFTISAGMIELRQRMAGVA